MWVSDSDSDEVCVCGRTLVLFFLISVAPFSHIQLVVYSRVIFFACFSTQSSGFFNPDFLPLPRHQRAAPDLSRDPLTSSSPPEVKLTAPLVTFSYEDGRTITLHPNKLEISCYVTVHRLSLPSLFVQDIEVSAQVSCLFFPLTHFSNMCTYTIVKHPARILTRETQTQFQSRVPRPMSICTQNAHLRNSGKSPLFAPLWY